MKAYHNSAVLQFDDSTTGNAGVGVPVTVRLNSTQALVSIFDLDEVAIANPTTTDSKGNYAFKTADGVYDIIISEGTSGEVVLEKVQISEFLGLINNLSQAYEFATVVDLTTSAIIFPAGKVLHLADRGASFLFTTGGTANGYDILDAGNGNTAVYVNDKGSINPKAFGVIYDANYRDPSAGNYYKDSALTILATNSQDSMQAAWDYAYYNGMEIKETGGSVRVTSIVFPPTAEILATRGDIFKVTGIGAGNIFVANPTKVARYVSTGVFPTLRVQNRNGLINGTPVVNISGIRFEAMNTDSTVDFEYLGTSSNFSEFGIKQWGEGDGLNIDYLLLANIFNGMILNKDAFTTADGLSTRFGAGIRVGAVAGGGIPTLRKITSRGFDTAYLLGEGATGSSNMAGLKVEQCESSVVRVGIDIRPSTLAATLDTCYFEGIEGVHIIDAGTATDVHGGMHYVNSEASGVTPVTYIDSSYNTKGNSYHNNYLETNNNGDTLIKIEGSSGKNCGVNTLLYASSTKSDITGVEILGVFPKITGIGTNIFEPRGNWLGTNCEKIRKSYTAPMVGSTQAQNGDNFICPLLLGAINYTEGQVVLTEAHMSGSTLVIPDDVNVFAFSPTTAVFVYGISASNDGARPIWLNCNDNVNFDNSAVLKIDGGARFTGAGSILLHVTNIGATNYTYEVSRALYL